MEEAERPVRAQSGKIGPHDEQKLGKVRIVGEICPERTDGAMVVGPERTGLAGTALRASHRGSELAETWFHVRSLAREPTGAIRDGAARRCGLLPNPYGAGTVHQAREPSSSTSTGTASEGGGFSVTPR
jgi:hypothetical protein